MQSRKQKKALLYRMFSVSAPDDPGNSVRNFRIRTYAGFRNHATSAIASLQPCTIGIPAACTAFVNRYPLHP
jgi:hypothetical protein